MVQEDCWFEEATSALINAWGRRYLELNSGNLRQTDWQVYERVEGEKQRMQFAKDLELQRMRMKRSWGPSGEAYSSS
ncbi:hypothetical protein Gorai_011989 [Gossypium raimondii]|uniref:Uncharacterized protein n=2 Tax=Gossypium TaxID=3633 RepID=A0A0D2RVC6_GOSRA|nr:hypothetical protein B456_009G162200 [Gossypium raimondii]MBA0595111.1 hypothetical protein [Gossypium raimondii]